MKIRKEKAALRPGFQLGFSGSAFIKPDAEFGGALLRGNPKVKRPISTSLPIHITLRATRSVLRLPKTHGMVNREIRRAAKRFGVRIYKMANVGNHIHVLVRIGKVTNWTPFIRQVTGRIAQLSRSLGLKIEQFWAYRPHTRIVASWGKAYRVVRQYIELNRLEADGFISRKEMPTTRELLEFTRLVQGTS